MNSKIKDIQLLKRFGIMILSVFIFYIIMPRIFKDMSILALSIILIILFIVNFIKLIRLKEIFILPNGVRIEFPYRFKKVEVDFDEIKNIEKKVIKGDGANGPGFIDFPSLKISIFLFDDSRYIFSTKENLNLVEIEKKLSRELTNRS